MMQAMKWSGWIFAKEQRVCWFLGGKIDLQINGHLSGFGVHVRVLVSRAEGMTSKESDKRDDASALLRLELIPSTF